MATPLIDLSPITRIGVPIIIIAGIAKILIEIFRPKVKGAIGEGFVNLAAKIHLDSGKYHLIKNVTIPTSRGTSQIDHVIVSRYGIFVVETKNMDGWIFGDAKQSSWTQVIYKKKTKFRNPIRQNYGHICALSELLDLPKKYFHSVICFMGDATFKTDMPAEVCQQAGYVSYIESFTERVLTEEQKADISARIEGGRLERSYATSRKHVQNVRATVREKRESYGNTSSPSTPPCPQCNTTMVKRTNRKDGIQFWGCPAYPKCRGTRSVTA